MADFEWDHTASGILVSFIAYIAFYALFVVAQLWWAFALIATGFYFIPLLVALHRKEKLISLICIVVHVIATCSIIGWSIFFFVSIFTGDTVNKWLTVYTKNNSNAHDVAKYASIAMSVDGALTAVFMMITAGLCYAKVRFLYRKKEEESVYEGTLAVNTEIDFPAYDPIPRLRTTSVGEIRGREGNRGGWESQSARYSRKIYTERF